MMRRLFSNLTLIFAVLLMSASILPAEQPLKLNDIHRVMDEMMEQQVEKPKMTSTIIHESFKNYINEFDPSRLYLFDSEVNNFLNMNPGEMDAIFRDYQRQDYSKYRELNRLIQNSIWREREYRKQILGNVDTLMQMSSPSPEKFESEVGDKKIPFATTVDELKSRIQQDVLRYISEERKRYGDRPVVENKAKIVARYARTMEHRENPYLFVNDDGVELSKQDQENLLTLHILKALSRSLDPHTAFLDPEEAYDMKVRLEKGFKGVGIVLQRSPEGVTISRLVKGGSAERSGKVKVNDLVVSVDGKNVESYPLEELVDLLREVQGDKIVLVLKRKSGPAERVVDETIPVTLSREMIELDEGRVTKEAIPVDNGIIGKLTLDSFYQGDNGVTTEKDMRKAIKELASQGKLRGLIIDLRENGGGFLNQAVKVAGLFITNGIVVVSKYSDGQEHFYRDMDGKVSFDGPIVILTSRATASAAEIVAQALQDYGVAIIVGDEHTYGKGTIQSQTVTDNDSGSHFKVTVGKYYTVSGRTPQLKGVNADVVVNGPYSHELIGEEYLQDTLSADTIKPVFKDPLSDVEPGLRPWYVRYYMPTLQPKETVWRQMIPVLQKNSADRIATKVDNVKDGKESELQMAEAVNIVKDMLNLEKEEPITQRLHPARQPR